VRTLYTSGLTDFQNVLDSERTLFSQQDQTVVSLGRRTAQLIDLYTALGGGWQNEPQSVDEVVASRNKQLLPILGYDLIEMDM
jgi:outer membrane protein TolC